MTLPRMLVLDLDGTALTGRSEIRQDDLEAALELKRRGVHVTIATGRLLSGTRWVARAMQIEGSIAVMNGSSRVNVATGTILHADPFSAPDQAAISEVLKAHDLPGFLFDLEQIHVHRDHLQYANYLKIWTPTLVEHDGEAWHNTTDILAIGAVGERTLIEAAGAVLSEQLPDLKSKYFDTFEGERFIEIRSSSHDKGTALLAMAAERGIHPDDVVAVGDWWNDLPMLRVAGHAYAMGGATPEVTEAAHHVLDAQTRHGGAIAELARRIWDI